MYHEEIFKEPQSEGVRFHVRVPGVPLPLQEGQRASGLLIHKPGQRPGSWPDHLNRKRIRLIRSFKHGVERFGFSSATNEKRDLSGVIEKNRGKRDSERP